jgi:hypothetical protein
MYLNVCADELTLSTSESKVLRKIYGPVYEKRQWRMSYISFIRHLISPELLKSQGCDGQDSFKR